MARTTRHASPTPPHRPATAFNPLSCLSEDQLAVGGMVATIGLACGVGGWLGAGLIAGVTYVFWKAAMKKRWDETTQLASTRAPRQVVSANAPRPCGLPRKVTFSIPPRPGRRP